MGPYTDVMVDCETTGINPGRHAMIQLAAVRFNLGAGTVDSNVFDKSLIMPHHRHWSESTRSWWLQQKEGVLQGIWERAEPWQRVMSDFVDWAVPTPGLRFWAKPSHFDFMFVSSYLEDADQPQIFHYRSATDMNSYIRGLYAPKEVDQAVEMDLEFEGDVHNALMDSFHQIKVLFAHYEKFRSIA